MRLSRIFAMNWYTYPLLEVDIMGVTALLGKNGSGKSTLLDMMQVVLCGANMKLAKFNIATGEGKARQTGERRTLKGYVLGKLAKEEEAYIRNEETQSLIALVFENEETNRYVTIGVALEADPKDTHAGVRALFIVDGARIEKADVGEDIDGGLMPYELDETLERLHEKGVQAGGEGLQRERDWRSYCRSYLYLLSGKRRSYQENEIRQLLKTLHRALAVTGQAENSTEFVRQYILEEDPVDLRGLRSSVDRFRELQKTVERLQQRLKWLHPLGVKCGEYREELEAAQTMGPIGDLARWCELKKRILDTKRDIRIFNAQEGKYDETIEKDEGRRREAQESLEVVRRQLNANGFEIKRDAAKLQIERAQLALGQARENASKHYQELMSRLRHLPGEWLENHRLLHASVEVLSNSLRGRRQNEWIEGAVEMEPELVGFFQLLQKAAPDHERIATKVSVELDKIRHRKEVVEGELNEAREGRTQVSPRVRAFQEHLRSNGIQSKLLFEAVDVLKPEWQASAEALLGRDREGIVVDPKQVQKAFSLYKELRREDAKDIRVFSTLKIEDESEIAEPSTLASVVTSADPMVRKILVLRLGRIRLASGTADFDKKGRSVLQVGKGRDLRIIFDDGLTIRDMSVDAQKLGRGAAATNIPRLEAELLALNRNFEELAEQQRELKAMERHIHALVEFGENRRPLSADAQHIETLQKGLREAQDEYERIGDQIDPELQAKERDLQRTIDALEGELEDQRDKRSRVRSRIHDLDAALEGEAMRPGFYAKEEDAKVAFHRSSAQLGHSNGERARNGLVRMREFVQKSGCARNYVTIERKANERKQDADVETTRLRGEIRESERGINRYFFEFGLPRPESDFETIRAVEDYVEQEIAKIRDNVLLEKEREMKSAASSAEDIFKKEFLGQIKYKLDATEKAIRDLNKNLVDRVFINKTYRFSRHVASSLSPIVNLAEKAQDDASIALPLFQAAGGENEEYAAAFDVIQSMLDDNTMDLSYYEDYRNYNVFDLISTDVTTGYQTNSSDRAGTGSGGELGAPAYIAIGAALAAVYYGGVKNVSAPFGVAMFDEAFLRLDGPTQRRLIDFFGSLQLQTILAAPPDKRQVVSEVVDTILDIRRLGNISVVRPIYLSAKAREALGKENPDNWSEEELRQRMAPEAAE